MGRAVGAQGLAGIAVLAGLTACGGPSEAERRAAADRWAQRVDAECRKANDAIAGRGWPLNLVDLDRLVARGVTDAQAAIDAIGRLRRPEGSGPAPGAFVRELEGLRPELDGLNEASEDLEPRALVEAAEGLKPRLAAVEKRAKAAGLKECLSHGERFFVPDAVRAPAFAQQLVRLDRRLLRRIRAIAFEGATTPGQLAVAFARLAEVVDAAIEGIDRLDPPQWAADQTAGYQMALRDLQGVIQKFTVLLAADRGKAFAEIDRAKYARTQRELDRVGRAEVRARKRMLRAVGAAPLRIPEGGGDGLAPESEQPS